ncbi:TPA: hypothetical protein ACK3Q6_008061 [Burkholderia cepacia]
MNHQIDRAMRYLAEEWTEVQVIVRKDGRPIDGSAHAGLSSSGAHFDADLGLFVIEAGGMPASYAVFLPTHELTVLRLSVPYNPAWYSERSPYPKFEELPLVFTGHPIDDALPYIPHWFLRRGCKRPFLSSYRDGGWSSDNGRVSPVDAVAQGWQVIATLRESIEMSYVMIDEAYARRASKAELKAIVQDEDGAAALRVAVEAGRLRH